MANELKNIKEELEKIQNPEKAKNLSKFFKTGKGQYGEGDIFLGIKVPDQRKIARKYSGIPLDDIGLLLKSNIHEFRLTALLILVQNYRKEDFDRKKEIFEFYLRMLREIGKRDDRTEEEFLEKYYRKMPRTMLRYAIEKFDNDKKKFYLSR